jgi:hypothetical protein
MPIVHHDLHRMRLECAPHMRFVTSCRTLQSHSAAPVMLAHTVDGAVMCKTAAPPNSTLQVRAGATP